jgi:hypothetical protein
MTERKMLTAITSAFSALAIGYGFYQALPPNRTVRAAAEVCCNYTSDCAGDNYCVNIECDLSSRPSGSVSEKLLRLSGDIGAIGKRLSSCRSIDSPQNTLRRAAKLCAAKACCRLRNQETIAQHSGEMTRTHRHHEISAATVRTNLP